MMTLPPGLYIIIFPVSTNISLVVTALIIINPSEKTEGAASVIEVNTLSGLPVSSLESVKSTHTWPSSSKYQKLITIKVQRYRF